jgi:hypothetical protein
MRDFPKYFSASVRRPPVDPSRKDIQRLEKNVLDPGRFADADGQ